MILKGTVLLRLCSNQRQALTTLARARELLSERIKKLVCEDSEREAISERYDRMLGEVDVLMKACQSGIKRPSGVSVTDDSQF